MSFEKVRIKSIETITSRKTGEQHHFLRVDLLKTYDIYMNDRAILLTKEYEKLKGHEVLLPVEFGTYNGNVSLNFIDDCKPIIQISEDSTSGKSFLNKSTA